MGRLLQILLSYRKKEERLIVTVLIVSVLIVTTMTSHGQNEFAKTYFAKAEGSF